MSAQQLVHIDSMTSLQLPTDTDVLASRLLMSDHPLSYRQYDITLDDARNRWRVLSHYDDRDLSYMLGDEYKNCTGTYSHYH